MKIYTTIEEMPLFNWVKINEKNDLSYMIIGSCKKINNKKLREGFEIIKDEFINTFGVSEVYKKILEAQIEIAKLEIDLALTGDNFLQNFIDMRLIDIKQLNEGATKGSHFETKMKLEKYLGFRLNEKEISVKEYYSYLKAWSEDAPSKAA